MINARLFLISLSLLALSACSSRPAPDLYVLRASDAEATTCTPVTSLMINRPTARDEYDNKRFAVLLSDNHLSYYTGASWASPFPEQLQDFLSDYFAGKGMNVVNTDERSGSNGRAVNLTIREAVIVNTGAPVVHLRLQGTIGGKRIRINESVAASENHMPQIVDAYTQAATQAAERISAAMKLHCR